MSRASSGNSIPLDGWISWNASPPEDGRPYSGNITEKKAFKNPAGGGYADFSSNYTIWDTSNGGTDATSRTTSQDKMNRPTSISSTRR
jgi:hypothetical protein